VRLATLFANGNTGVTGSLVRGVLEFASVDSDLIDTDANEAVICARNSAFAIIGGFKNAPKLTVVQIIARIYRLCLKLMPIARWGSKVSIGGTISVAEVPID
jgi:hypothetical protein